MAPLIPFVQVPELPLSFLKYIPLLNRAIDPLHPPTIKPFGTLVAIGVYVGSVVGMRHARQRGLNEKKMSEFIFWTIGMGFIGGHVLDAIFYHPDRVMDDPLYIIKLWEGLSSYGGFVGALVGALAWRFSRKEAVLGYIECVASAFPVGWFFGRMGCASVHDHPGHRSDLWFAVQWPMGRGHAWEGRFDLGFIEMTLMIPLVVAFWILWEKKPQRPIGFYMGVLCTSYAPVRFFLDFLREDESNAFGGDPRYAGLTPAQWACFALLGAGLYFLRMWKKGLDAGEDTTDPSSAPQIEVALATGTALIPDETDEDEPAKIAAKIEANVAAGDETTPSTPHE